MTLSADNQTTTTQLSSTSIQDTSKTLRRSVSHFFSGTALSRIFGMFRDMLMAFAFGSEPLIAAFMIAFRFSNLFRRMFGEGAMQSAFTPLFEDLRKQNKSSAMHFFKEIAWSLTIFLVLLSGLVEIILLIVYQLMELSDGNKEIIKLTAIMLPGIIFICLYGLNASFLQCQNKFFTPSVAPAAFNIIWILVVLIIMNDPSDRTIYKLSVGIVIAYFFQWFMTFPSVLSFISKEKKLASVKLFSSNVKLLLKPLFLGIIAVSASQINSAVDPLFARVADLEGPAYLWYAIRLQQLPLALIGIAFSGALLPALSRAVKNADYDKYAELLNYGLKKVLSLMIPITFAMLALGFSLVNLIFGRGHFDNQAVEETTRCLWGYCLGITPMVLVLLFSCASFANSHFSKPAFASFITMLINVLLNFIFIFLFKSSAAGVAVATSIASFCNCFIMSFYAPKRSKWNHSLSVFKTLIASFCAFIATLAFGFLFFNDPTYLLFQGQTLHLLPRDVLSQCYSIIVQGLFFLLSLLLCAKGFNSYDILALFGLRKKNKGISC